MLRTYKAVLNGDRLEWSDEVPPSIAAGQPVPVHVTILDEVALRSQRQERGERMAAALERLATTDALSDITDPVAWHREMRRDRGLPRQD